MDGGRVVGVEVEGAEVFLCKEGIGCLACIPMHADVGHGVHPQPRLGVDGVEGAEFASGQEVAFDVADGALDAALFVG